jgi:transcriptional regulator GlxA family with amidase domain
VDWIRVVKADDSRSHVVPVPKTESKSEAAMNPRVRRAVEFLRSNLHREVTLGDICKEAGVQRSRLCELFQIEFGTAPTHYHKTLRLEKASERCV